MNKPIKNGNRSKPIYTPPKNRNIPTSAINKYGLEHFQNNLDRLDDFLSTTRGTALVAVFDIGTRAGRLLVAPKDVPSNKESWNPKAFFNDGQVFNLGGDFNIHSRMLNINSISLEGAIYFINVYKEKLKKNNRVADSDISAVGTAVFRWLKNRAKVIGKIKSETGVEVIVLEENDESLLSSISVYHTTSLDRQYQENEALLLFDQGGGSTEISYFYPKSLRFGKQDSINDLGTVVLQKMFFGLRNDGKIEDPETNKNRISTQFQRINKYIEDKINRWEGFPEIMENDTNLYAFGMGTAILKCFGGNSYSQHNKLLSIADMDRILNDYARSEESLKQNVKTLYRAVKEESRIGKKDISTQLVLLYGLPVYQKMLKKFSLEELRYASYGLRYGAYVAKYRFGLDLSHPNRINLESKLNEANNRG